MVSQPNRLRHYREALRHEWLVLAAEWDDADFSARWSGVYDGICEDLKDGAEPDFILELVDQLETAVGSEEAARQGVVEQVEAVSGHLCPSQASAIGDLRTELLGE